MNVNMLFRVLIIVLTLSITGCSSWIYRIDIPQGNYLEQKDIDKLEIGMTKEQVKFILGSPLVNDAFDEDTWYYVYRFRSGRNEDLNIQKDFIVTFADDKVTTVDLQIIK